MSAQLKSISVVGGLLLILQLPIGMVQSLTTERMETRDDAERGVWSSWGAPQFLSGPRLLVPVDDQPDAELVTFLASEVHFDTELTANSLRRGIFDVLTYEGSVRIYGSFTHWGERDLTDRISEAGWQRAQLVLGTLLPRAIGTDTEVRWRGESMQIRPGSSPGTGSSAGVHAVVPADGATPADFEITLSVRGSEGVHFSPMAEVATVSVRGDWATPSFTGWRLPRERSVTADGFSADWSVPALSQGIPHEWSSSAPPSNELLAEAFGVELIQRIDAYRMAERSIKYAPLFLLLTFGMLWLLDTVGRLGVHPMHYALVGVAICLFYLLELSLSEHLGFLPAYLIATGAIAGLIGCYAKAILRATSLGATAGGGVAALYAYLLLVLTLQEYALLAGSLALFGLLALTMYATRHVDWHSLDVSAVSQP